MADPLLGRGLEVDLGNPIDLVGSSTVVRRLRDVVLCLAVDFHPFLECMVVDHILLPLITEWINKVNTNRWIVTIDLLTALVEQHECRLDTGCGLGKNRD